MINQKRQSFINRVKLNSDRTLTLPLKNFLSSISPLRQNTINIFRLV